jgi:dTDP-4-dehydrorhamnose 3,5-epimerase
METESGKLPGVLIIKPDVYGDSRGNFRETWRQERYRPLLGDIGFVQDNLSYSQKGALRGLHFQHPHTQGKLVQTVRGEVFDVVVDVRRGSPTFGHWEGHLLSDANGLQLWVPPGYAHGFCVTSDEAYFLYKCTAAYVPDCDRSLLWSDADLAIDWPVEDPTLSAKDAAGICLADFADDQLPEYRG